MPAIASTIALSDYPGGVSTKESIVNALTAGDPQKRFDNWLPLNQYKRRYA